MTSSSPAVASAADAIHQAEPILALDAPGAAEALALVDLLPRADFVKVGLQLYTAAGPDVVRELRARGRRVFLDLKLHDIPNTVAGAVASAGALGVDLLTLHAGGGRAMLRAAAEAAAAVPSLRLLGVTVLTSLSGDQLAEAWGREPLRVQDEVVRLAALARESGIHGVVASVAEAGALRAALGHRLRILTPGIRLAGDSAGDQARVATPADAARMGSDYIIIGRTVTAAADPVAAWDRVLDELSLARAEASAR